MAAELGLGSCQGQETILQSVSLWFGLLLNGYRRVFLSGVNVAA